MSPLTHLLIGWEVGRRATHHARDRHLVAMFSVAPGLDGLGWIVDRGRQLLGMAPLDLYATYHHRVFHGLLGALCAALLAAAMARERVRTSLLCVLAVHLHLLCDAIGSRGPAPQDLWPLHYLAPFSNAGTFAWTGQWPLNGCPNLLLTAVLLAMTCSAALRDGESPFLLAGARANEAFLSLLRRLPGVKG